MRMISLWISIFVLLVTIFACAETPAGSEYIPSRPDYSKTEFWYPTLTEGNQRRADIFYIYHTLDTKPVDPDGNRIYYADIYLADERKAAASAQRYIKEVYADTLFNFYAPLYRQMTIEPFIQGDAVYKMAMELPLEDVVASFDYYMKHLNKGRPFILMGHSQGSLMLIELLKRHMTTQQLNSMIVAVLMGFQITSEDLTNYPDKLRPACGKDDLGVIVNFNSLTYRKALSPLISRSAVCINPINWRTDGVPATQAEHKGIYRYDKQAGTYKLTPNFTGGYIVDNYMICTEIDPHKYYVESIKNLFPLGCLHLTETWLYSANIKENLTWRTDKFFGL